MCLVDESFTELLTSEGFKKNGVVMLRNFLNMQLSGMLQVFALALMERRCRDWRLCCFNG